MEVKQLIGLTHEFWFQIANTVILFLILKKYLFQPVMGIIEEREKDIRESLAQGENAKKEGISFKNEYESKLSTATEQGQEIVKQATLRAEQKEAEIVSNAKEEATAIREKANKDVEQERQKVMNEIKNDISDIALLAASKVIEKDIDKSKHKELIDNFIKEVGESK